MRQAITTKFLGPTDSKGSRMKAIARKRSTWGPEMSATVSRDYAKSVEENHCAVAKACAEKFDWSGLWVGGGNVDEDGYVFVNVATVADAAVRSNMHGVEGRDWFFIAKREG